LAAGNLCHTAAGLGLPSGFDSGLNAAVSLDKDPLDQFGCDILWKLRSLLYDFIQCDRHAHIRLILCDPSIHFLLGKCAERREVCGAPGA
jgi:hypothetical protein